MATTLSEKGKKRITSNFQILGVKEWYKKGDKDFYSYAEQLMNKGYTEEEAIDFLGGVYNTVANEYGD